MVDSAWLPYLKEWPGLLLAGAVIYALFRLLGKTTEHSMQMLALMTEQRTVLSEVVTLLRTLCARKDGGREQ